jgi:nitrate reductase NapE component
MISLTLRNKNTIFLFIYHFLPIHCVYASLLSVCLSTNYSFSITIFYNTKCREKKSIECKRGQFFKYHKTQEKNIICCYSIIYLSCVHDINNNKAQELRINKFLLLLICVWPSAFCFIFSFSDTFFVFW